MADAAKERKTAWRLRILGSVAALLASAVLLFAAGQASDGKEFDGLAFIAYSSAAVPPLLLGVLFVVNAARHASMAGEAVRLRRQLIVLDAYVARLPHRARSLVLASLAPRFFAQHLDAEDQMLVEHPFPPPDQLLAAIDPEIYAAVTGEVSDEGAE